MSLLPLNAELPGPPRSLLPALLLLLAGCGSYYGPQQQQEIEQLVRVGRFADAAEQHDKYQQLYPEQDELLFYLNQSNLDYYSSITAKGQNALPQRSAAFERAEDLLRLNDAGQNSFAEQAGQNPYEGYLASLQESLWHNAFASLYYWNRNSLDGALVELRRSHQKVEIYRQYAQQSESRQSRPSDHKDELLDFRDSALMQYLGMVYYRADRRWDDWRISYENLNDLTTNSSYYPRRIPDWYLPQERIPVQSGAINFAVFTGAGVRKYAQAARIVKVPGGVLLQIDGEAAEELGFGVILLPSLSKNFSYYELQIPMLRQQQNSVDRVEVYLDGELRQELYPLEPFARINAEVFRRLRADFLPRQIAAFVLKVAVSEVTQVVLSSNSKSQGAGLIAGLVGSILTAVTSPVPDLRVPGFYPSQGWVGEVFASPGRHVVELRYYSGSSLLHRKIEELAVAAGTNRIVQDYYAQ